MCMSIKITCTEFQICTSYDKTLSEVQDKVLDYTEYRLRKLIKKEKDENRKFLLQGLLNSYLSGQSLIAWRQGRPVHKKHSENKDNA